MMFILIELLHFYQNEPVTNDQMEQVLGMIGNTPSRVRKMILRSECDKNASLCN